MAFNSNPYTASGAWPYVTAAGGVGPLSLQTDGEVFFAVPSLKASLDIASVSNTTPIQVTLAVAAGWLVTGQKVFIVDSDDTAANGLQTITVLSPTVISLDGTTADGGGGAAGVVLDPQFGAVAKLIDAAAIAGHVLGYSGGSLLGDPIAIPVATTVNNIFAATANATLSGTTSTISGEARITGRRSRGARVPLSDTDHTIKVTDGNRFQVSNSPAMVRTITLSATSPTPDTNETIEILMPGPSSTGKQYIIKRADGTTTIAEFWGNSAGDAGAWAEFEFVGGVWVLGANGGGGAAGGVLSGPGAA